MTHDDESRMKEIAALKREGEMEGLLMGLETVSITLATINAQMRMVDAHLKLGLDTPEFNEAEKQVRDEMLKSIATRVLRLGQLAAQIDGTPPPPTTGNVADIIQSVMQEARDHYTGTQDNSNAPTPDDSLDFLDDVNRDGTRTPFNPCGEIALPDAGGDLPPPYDPDEPLVPSDEFMEKVYADENWLADMPVADDEDNLTGEVYNGPDAYLEDGTPVEFKTVRSRPQGVPFDVRVFNSFPKLDFRDEEQRHNAMVEMLSFYVDTCSAAAASGLIDEDYALRIAEEVHMTPNEDLTNPEILIRMPAEIAVDIAQRSAAGEDVITVMVKETDDVGEAIISAFMTSMAKFNTNVSAAYLQERLREIGMSA